MMQIQIKQTKKTSGAGNEQGIWARVTTDKDETISEGFADTVQEAVARAVEYAQNQLQRLISDAKKTGLLRDGDAR